MAMISSVVIRTSPLPTRRSASFCPRLGPRPRGAGTILTPSPSSWKSTSVCGSSPACSRRWMGMVTCPYEVIRTSVSSLTSESKSTQLGLKDQRGWKAGQSNHLGQKNPIARHPGRSRAESRDPGAQRTALGPGSSACLRRPAAGMTGNFVVRSIRLRSHQGTAVARRRSAVMGRDRPGSC